MSSPQQSDDDHIASIIRGDQSGVDHRSLPSMKQGRKNRKLKPTKRYRSYLAKILFSVTAFLLCVALVGYLSFYFLKGETINNQRLTAQLQASIQDLVSEDFDIEIGATEVKIESATKVNVVSTAIRLTSKANHALQSNIEEIKVSIDPISVALGTPKLGQVLIRNADVFLPSKTASTQEAPLTLSNVLGSVGQAGKKLKNPLEEKLFKGLTLENVRFYSADKSGVIEQTPSAQIINGNLGQRSNDDLAFEAQLKLPMSNPKLTGDWVFSENSSSLSLTAQQIDVGEWINSPETGPDSPTGIGSDAIFNVSANLPFSNDFSPLQATVRLSSAQSTFRVGKLHATQLDNVELNFRLLPTHEEIELERSTINASDRTFNLTGNAKPIQKEQGFKSPLDLNLTVRDASEKTIASTNGEAIQGEVAAVWDIANRQLSLTNTRVFSGEDEVTGSGVFVFDTVQANGQKRSPAISASLTSQSFSFDKLKSVWPFFIAKGASKWVGQHVHGGVLKNAKLELNAPTGRTSSLYESGGFQSEEISFIGEFENAEVDTFGSLPPLIKGRGEMNMKGNALNISASDGALEASKGKSVKVVDALVKFPEVISRKISTNITAVVEGNLSELANILDKAPLNAAKKAGLSPSALKGKGLIDLVTDFVILPGSKISNLNWSAIANVEKASSSKKIFSRSIKDADLLIEATPNELRVKGKAKVDGVQANLLVVEPLSKNSKAARVRNFGGEMSDEALAQLGFDVSAVIKGKIGIEQASKNGATHYKLDLTKADISLPWISWLKGTGIPANAQFELSTSKGVSTLKNLKLTGQGIDAAGQLVFNKSGLIAANLKNVTLVGNENFDVDIKYSKQRYTVNVSGQAFDARAIINQLFHEDGDIPKTSKSNISLTAKLSKVYGFRKQTLSNAAISYQMDDGRLSLLKVDGTMPSGKSVRIDANTNGSVTTFDFDLQDGGASLAMVDIYRKAMGGRLVSRLTRDGNGPFRGNVKMRGFTVVGEERLAAFSNAKVAEKKFSKIPDELKKINTKSVTFRKAEAFITKGSKSFAVKDGIIRSNEIGFTFEGDVYDKNEQMNIRGTFMPLIAVSRLVGLIPIIGQIFSNGNDSALLGITYQLKGAAKNPKVAVNPISIVAPGIFNKVFEFQK